jgi:hypothetical protein
MPVDLCPLGLAHDCHQLSCFNAIGVPVFQRILKAERGMALLTIPVIGHDMEAASSTVAHVNLAHQREHHLPRCGFITCSVLQQAHYRSRVISRVPARTRNPVARLEGDVIIIDLCLRCRTDIFRCKRITAINA